MRSVLIAAALISLAASQADAQDVAGPARVVDGDTLDVAGVRVRLAGIDAPEKGQWCRVGGALWPCGREATRALRALVDGRSVACRGLGRERHARLLATCTVGGRDLGRALVLDGWALAYTRYDLSYVLEETYAQVHARGLWRGQFVEPWRWRKGAR